MVTTTDPDIILTVSEREKRDGVFDVHHDGRYLLTSGGPFIDGCRHLLAQGYNPAARVVMRHEGSTDDALRGILANVAGVDIAGNGVGFRPFRGRAEMAAASPMRLSGLPATTLAASS
jgi:hypothetical protein